VPARGGGRADGAENDAGIAVVLPGAAVVALGEVRIRSLGVAHQLEVGAHQGHGGARRAVVALAIDAAKDQGTNGLELLVAAARRDVARDDLVDAWRNRSGNG
jgi:hypothetical protein